MRGGREDLPLPPVTMGPATRHDGTPTGRPEGRSEFCLTTQHLLGVRRWGGGVWGCGGGGGGLGVRRWGGGLGVRRWGGGLGVRRWGGGVWGCGGGGGGLGVRRWGGGSGGAEVGGGGSGGAEVGGGSGVRRWGRGGSGGAEVGGGVWGCGGGGGVWGCGGGGGGSGGAEVGGGGLTTPPPRTPPPHPTPFSDWVNFFSGPSANQKFSLAPSELVSLGQKISSAPLTAQGLPGGGGSPPQPPPPPTWTPPPQPKQTSGDGKQLSRTAFWVVDSSRTCARTVTSFVLACHMEGGGGAKDRIALLLTTPVFTWGGVKGGRHA